MFNTKDIQERYTKRNEDVTAAAVKIHALIEDCQKYYKADVSSETWKSYLQYIDELIVEGLLKVLLLYLQTMWIFINRTLVKIFFFYFKYFVDNGIKHWLSFGRNRSQFDPRCSF